MLRTCSTSEVKVNWSEILASTSLGKFNHVNFRFVQNGPAETNYALEFAVNTVEVNV